MGQEQRNDGVNAHEPRRFATAKSFPDASLVPTLKINGQPASGRPPGNGEPGGYAQWLDGLVYPDSARYDDCLQL